MSRKAIIQKEPAVRGLRSGPPKTVWAYAYEIVPAQDENLPVTIRTLLARENSAARRAARTWAGRVVVERNITHILVVSDSPEQDREVNIRLEAELTELKAAFSVTIPMELAKDAGRGSENIDR